MKKQVSINTTLFSMPVACVSVGSWDNANIITLAYIGKVCMTPPIIAIGVHPARHSHQLLLDHLEFVINVPTVKQARIMDACGVMSGKTINKWHECGLTKERGKVVSTPMIKECPFNMECKIVGTQSFGSHTVFFGEVVENHIDEKYLNNGAINGNLVDQIIYINGTYFNAERKTQIAYQGFSKRG